MSKLNSVADEVFRILRSFDIPVALYDEDGNATKDNKVLEPEEARRFYSKKNNITVSISDENEDSSINLYLSASTDIKQVLGLITALRMCATKYNMMFHDSRNFKADFEPKDFASKFSVREAKETMTDLTEGMYGTSRSSYLKLENARMIVRHSKTINEDSAGARTRNIDKIFVENAEGERFLMPTRQISAGRAMTQHFNHGGTFGDDVAQQINRMTQDFADLGACQSYCTANAPVLAEGAQSLVEECKTSRQAIKETFSRLFRESTYAEEASALREAAASPVLVEDAVLQSLREMLTVEGKELNETMLEAVARHCRKGDRDVADEALTEGEAEPKEREETTWNKIDDDGNFVNRVTVLGKEVSKQAWTDFMGRKLDLMPAIEDNRNPRFTNKLSEITYKVQNVAKRCEDSSMSTLLSYVADLLADPPARSVGGPTTRQLLMVAQHALACAGETIVSEGVGLGFRGVRAIREFEEWMNHFLPDRILTESPYPDDFRGLPSENGPDDADFEHMMDEIMHGFDVEEMARDLNPDATEGEVRAAIDSTLRKAIALEDVNLSIGTDLSSYVEELVPLVMAHLPLSEETFEPILDPGEELLAEDDFALDDGFDEEAAREIIAKLVQDGYSEGKAHDFSWELKIAEEHRDSESEMAYLARSIREGNSEGHHPRWVLTITPMVTGGRFPGVMEGEELSEGPLMKKLARGAAALGAAAAVGSVGVPIAKNAYDYHRGGGGSMEQAQDNNAYNDAVKEYKKTHPVEEGEELTREDVLLPKDQGADLKGEVMKKPVPTADSNGDKMIAELTRLAGLNR